MTEHVLVKHVNQAQFEDILKTEMAILTDLVSDPIGTEDDECGSKIYPRMYFFGTM